MTAPPPYSAKNQLNASTVGWIRTDGVVISPNRATLLLGSLSNPINHDEFGNDLSADSNRAVMTGTNSDGQVRTNNTCHGWSLSAFDSTMSAATGYVDYATGMWTYTESRGCNLSARLYCFETDF